MTAAARTARSASAKSKTIVEATSNEFEKRFRNPSRDKVSLRLYITGTTPRSCLAVANIRSLCEELLPKNYDLEVIDIYQQPEEATDQQIIAAPTLIKQFPLPSKRLVGDLSDRKRVLVALDLVQRKSAR